MGMNGNSDLITREFFESLLIESRYLDSILPSTTMELYGETFDTPIMTAALSHLGNTAKEEYPFQLEECACGQGSLDLKLFANLATQQNEKMPMIIEHLHSDKEYEASVNFVKSLLGL